MILRTKVKCKITISNYIFVQIHIKYFNLSQNFFYKNLKVSRLCLNICY